MPKHMTQEQRDEAIRLYQSNVTVDSIAEHFDRDRTTICRLVGRKGVRRGRPFRSEYVDSSQISR